jgi:BASS family bile acid:Na+ symporter
MILVFLAFVPIVIKVWPALVALVGNGTVLAMAGTATITLLCGHFLGGPDLRDRTTLAMASSIRHPGIAISVAGTAFNEPRVSAAIVLFLLTGLIVSVPYTVWAKRACADLAN